MAEQPIKPTKRKKEETALVAATQLSPDKLISLAITQGANVDTMGKLMDLQDRWESKQAKRAYDDAMAAFQAECPVIKKNKIVKDNSGRTLYHYAPLESIVTQVKKLIQKHGFSYAVKTKTTPGMITAVCVVKHAMGHSEESELEVPTSGGTGIMSATQKVAAALTFAKRYAFCNAFGIMTGDEDTDAREEGPATDDLSSKRFKQIDELAKAGDEIQLQKLREQIMRSKMNNQEKMQYAGYINDKLKALNGK